VRGVAWTGAAIASTTLTLDAPLGPGWPWPGRCEQVIELHPDRLVQRATIQSGGEPFPAVLGWHPWYVKPSSVDLDAGAMLERGRDMIPTGRRLPAPEPGTQPLDDCFEDVRWPAVLRFDGGLDVRIDGDGCRYAVVFDRLAETTCVEPQTAPPNALNSGEATIVEPGRPLRATMLLSWR
jgi:aldose 1-epimerase